MYRDIETFSKKSRFTKFIYRLVFKPVASAPVRGKLAKRAHAQKLSLEGKIIRKIHIVILDPIGYSVSDTAAIPRNIIAQAGNAVHIQTLHLIIRNILLIHENEPYDSLLVNESERLVRGQNYVREVAFTSVPDAPSSDSVDIQVRVQDKWSIIPNSAFSTARVTIGFTEKNFVGLGHELHYAYGWNHSTGKKAFVTDYSIPNIRNTHIGTVLHYAIDENDNAGKSLTMERPFYSPLAQWAAGLGLSRQFRSDAAAGALPGQASQGVRWTAQDYWFGNANSISWWKTEEERTTSAVIAARYLRIRYLEKPNGTQEPLPLYADEDFYLSGIGISTRTYVRDQYIYNFGVIEDVPVGKVYGITAGYQVRNNANRWYAGARVSVGNYHHWGYVSSTMEYGTFLQGRSMQQGVIVAGVNYFSELFEIGSWRMRQFIKPRVTWGLHRFGYESLTMTNENGMRGYVSPMGGTRKIAVTLQTQSYAPWQVLGFRFGPYLIGSFGMLGNTAAGFRNSQLFSQYGIGALIKNEYLVLSNFQFSVAFYPSIPGAGRNIIRLNAFRTTDFGLSDFIFGKPETAAFQ